MTGLNASATSSSTSEFKQLSPRQALADIQEPLSLLGACLAIDGGTFSVHAMPSFGIIGTAHLKDQTLVLLRQKKGETMFAFLNRLEHTLAAALITGEVIDEVNEPPAA
ncbi:hypothetical protein [Cupriavidus necator]